MINARIFGAGSYVPPLVVSNERIVRAIPYWSAEHIESRTGIRERRFLYDFSDEIGARLELPSDAYPRSGVDMAEIAVREALASSKTDAGEVDAVIYLSATPDEINFSHDAILLHKRLGCRDETKAIVLDAGCGTALYAMDFARQLIASGEYRRIVLVAVHLPSAYLHREVFTSDMPVGGKSLNAALTMYLFGDGAGAVILGPSHGDAGFIASYAGTGHSELMVRRGGGATRPPHPNGASVAEMAYYINGKLVAEAFPTFMREAIGRVLQASGIPKEGFHRYFLHQANKVIVEKFVADYGLPRERLSMHMDRYGNMNAAATLVLLAEDLRDGHVALDSGQVVLFAAIGAGIHYGAHALRL